MRRAIMIGIIVAVVLGAGCVRPARATQSYGSQLGWGLMTIGANLLYAPTKLVYATLGGVTGALAYVLTVGHTDTVQRIWSPSLGGTYVLTPAMLRGDEPILFSGESYD